MNIRHLICFVALIFYSATSYSNEFDYRLQAKKIATDTYVFVGKDEDFNFANGGNVLNTSFIVTTDGVVVIDTGPSYFYGKQMQEAISRITDKPIKMVIVTHAHPDHYLGNQAFKSSILFSTTEAIQEMNQTAEQFSSNMYRMVGDAMKSTLVTIPKNKLQEQSISLGKHRLAFINKKGHSSSDLVVFDYYTGVMFTGDLIFNNRAATTPQADIAEWLMAIDDIASYPAKLYVPGHGAIFTSKNRLLQTKNYLKWLLATIKDGVKHGMTAGELIHHSKIPKQFDALAVLPLEFQRSVLHLFPSLEKESLGQILNPTK